jgi:tetratricopeptide (TPR) repeat protein
MSDRTIKILVFAAIFVVVFGIYYSAVAPTASFWDCGEFVAVCWIMGVPHPPGTPLFVTLGRIFAMLPLAQEPAMRINFIPLLFGAFSCGLIYMLVLKLTSYFTSPERKYDRWLPHVAGVFGALACAFAFSFWDNSVEAEVYGPCVVVALTVLYVSLLWSDKVRDGTGDNRLILLSMFLLFLSAGIHFTPMLTVFAVLIFALIVDREAIIQLRFFELFAGYLIILTATELGFTFGMVVAVLLMLGATWACIKVLENSDKWWKLLAGFGLLGLVWVIGYVAAGNKIMDDTVLFIASPTVALVERWVRSPVAAIALGLGFAAYLYWLHRQGRLSMKYVGLMLGLVILASSVQFIMYIRAKNGPSINEVNPSNWRDFVSVLKREQYDPMKLFPRKTQFLTEDEWRMNQNPQFGLLRAYFEQIKFYVRYFFWQWGGERYFDIFLHVKWQAILGLIPPLLGLWGMWTQFRKSRRSFVLIFVAFIVASLGLLTYLNLKYSPSDPRPELKFREVRERDYFYAFSFVFYTIFIGVGAYAFLRSFADSLRNRKLPTYAMSGALLAFGFVPMLLNYSSVTRRGDWIPAEYGYNMLASCPGDKTVIFTNGDNDTFPLWFMQTVPSKIAGMDPNFGKNVSVANLSLLNTNWYCKQMKRWGAPISFTLEQLDKLPQGFVGKNNRTYLLKDIMIRDIVATAGGVKLSWPNDYACTPEEYQLKVFGPGYVPRTPVYFATTVSRDNLAEVEPYLRLEGLVNRVVGEKGVNQVDAEKTRRLLYEVYKMNSMLDPKVEKDDNTRGLLINYAASYLALASEYQKAGNNADAQKVIESALKFNLDGERKVPLFYHASVMAMLNGNYDQALGYLDSIEGRGFHDPELALRRGYAYQGKGDLQKAEAAYRQSISEDPNRPDPIQALYRLYLDDLGDTSKAKAVLEAWLKRAPVDTIAQRMLKAIS